MRHGSNEPSQHPDEGSDLNLRKGINSLKIFQRVDVYRGAFLIMEHALQMFPCTVHVICMQISSLGM